MFLYTLPQLAAPLIAGPLMDRFSRRKTIYVLDFLSAGIYILMGLTTSGALLGELLAGVCMNFMPMRVVLAGFMGIALLAAFVIIGGGKKYVKPLYEREA